MIKQRVYALFLTLALDTPLVTYLPDFTMADARYTQITVRMLRFAQRAGEHYAAV